MIVYVTLVVSMLAILMSLYAIALAHKVRKRLDDIEQMITEFEEAAKEPAKEAWRKDVM